MLVVGLLLNKFSFHGKYRNSKHQKPNHKQIPINQIQNPKLRFESICMAGINIREKMR